MSFCQRLCKVCICIPLQVFSCYLQVGQGHACLNFLRSVSNWSWNLYSLTRIRARSHNRNGQSFATTTSKGLGDIIRRVVFYDMSFCQWFCKLYICIPLQVFSCYLQVG